MLQRVTRRRKASQNRRQTLFHIWFSVHQKHSCDLISCVMSGFLTPAVKPGAQVSLQRTSHLRLGTRRNTIKLKRSMLNSWWTDKSWINRGLWNSCGPDKSPGNRRIPLACRQKLSHPEESNVLFKNWEAGRSWRWQAWLALWPSDPAQRRRERKTKHEMSFNVQLSH